MRIAALDLIMDRAQCSRTVAIVEAGRDAVGPDVDLVLDGHGRLKVPTAVAMCRALAPPLALTAPGLGAELNEEPCARFPYAPHDVPLLDGLAAWKPARLP